MRHCKVKECPNPEHEGTDGFCKDHYVLAWLRELGLDAAEVERRDRDIRRGVSA